MENFCTQILQVEKQNNAFEFQILLQALFQLLKRFEISNQILGINIYGVSRIDVERVFSFLILAFSANFEVKTCRGNCKKNKYIFYSCTYNKNQFCNHIPNLGFHFLYEV
jgi:hypothetical protein